MSKKKPLAGKRVLVTGVGMKPVNHVFYDISTGKPSHTSIRHGVQEYKANIGAAAALECAKAGAEVCLLARSKDKLIAVKQWIEEHLLRAKISFLAADINDIEKLEQELLPFIAEDEAPTYWVQCVGLGAGTVQLADDNPYLRIEKVTKELLDAEHSVLTSTVSMMQLLLPYLREQKETRICIVSSMSAIRSVISGSAHNASKGALSRFANAAMLELHKDHIYVTDVRPGAIDTGLYDSEIVQKTVAEIANSYSVDWSQKNGGLRLAPPSAVGKAIVTALSSEAHITSINMVSRGQFPHEGS